MPSPPKVPYGSVSFHDDDDNNNGAVASSINDERRQLLHQQSSALSSTQGTGGGFGSEAVVSTNDDGKGKKKDDSYLQLSLRNSSTSRKVEENLLLLDTNDFRKRYTSVHNDPDVEHLQNRENLWGSTRILNAGAWYELSPGSIQQSIVVATAIAVVNGVACWVYYTLLETCLELFWHTLPKMMGATEWPESFQWMWIPFISVLFCALNGFTVVLLGEPGDMPFTISCVHGKGYIPMDHVMPMVVASFCSILAAGSLGPEAPLVAICGALGGFVSRRIFGERHRNVVRKHTLMGMAGALSAFFGAPLGGSLFALEINSRFGVEYFEHMSESIFCGELTLVVFRAISGLDIAHIWDIGIVQKTSHPWSVMMGVLLGLVGAGLAYIFALFHANVMHCFGKLNLLDNSSAVYRALLGGLGFIIMGLLIPQTLFWSESEIPVQANGFPASKLLHVWPTSGLLGFESDSAAKSLLVGFAKLGAISFTVAGGLRGGFIFPLMFAGAAVGRTISLWTGLPLPLSTLCVAAGTNVAITRAALGTSLVLTFLSGQLVVFPSILMAALTSLFATSYLKFLKTQICRCDVDHSLYRTNTRDMIDDDEHEEVSDDE
eukprot:scaffold108_cov162-Amphora_coffeaeformis.AAC.2